MLELFLIKINTIEFISARLVLENLFINIIANKNEN